MRLMRRGLGNLKSFSRGPEKIRPILVGIFVTMLLGIAALVAISWQDGGLVSTGVLKPRIVLATVKNERQLPFFQLPACELIGSR